MWVSVNFLKQLQHIGEHFRHEIKNLLNFPSPIICPGWTVTICPAALQLDGNSKCFSSEAIGPVAL